MNLIRRVINKILGIHTYTPNECSDRLIEQIRKGGGKVGKNVDILESSLDLSLPFYIIIGDNVTITGVKILTHDASVKKFLGYTKTGKVKIGNNVFIGWGSIILPNTIIGSNVIIGAGTVVAKDIPDNVVVCGNPWKVLCSFEEYLAKNKAIMNLKPVIDLRPDQIVQDKSTIRLLTESGNGYML